MYWRRIAELPGWLKAVMVGQVVSSAGALAWIYLTLYLVEERGMSAQQAGFAAAAYGVGLLGGNLGGGWFGDRFGLRTAAIASQLAWAVTCLTLPLVPAGWIGVVAALAGLCGGASSPNLSALVATALPSERRREGIALSRTASNAGFTIGPPLGGLLAAYDFSLVFVVDAVSSLVLAAVIWRWVPGVRRTSSPAGVGVWRVLLRDRTVLVLLATIVVVDTVYRQVFATMPLLLRDAGSPAVAYGVLIGLSSVVIVCCEAPLAVRLRGHRSTRVIAVGFALVGVGWPSSVSGRRSSGRRWRSWSSRRGRCSTSRPPPRMSPTLPQPGWLGATPACTPPRRSAACSSLPPWVAPRMSTPRGCSSPWLPRSPSRQAPYS